MQTTITLRVTDIMTEVVQKVRRSKTASTNMADKINKTNSSKPTTISEHFLCNSHNATDKQLIPLELVQSNRDSVRKAREAYLIERSHLVRLTLPFVS